MSTSTPSSDPDVLRSQIENTRRELGADVDALADKVDPNKIVQRQTDKVRGAVSSVKDKLMGAGSDAGSNISGVADNASGVAHDAVDKAKGNPLAVGLIAFGVGWLLSSLMPASTVEKQVAANVKDAAEPLLDQAKGVAQEMGENLKQPLTDAAEAVKGTATDAASTVKAEGTSSAEDVRDTAKHASSGQ
jgi:ElaB/YqjD/DUF883 family membrane-anchored ribosome-binding protein